MQYVIANSKANAKQVDDNARDIPLTEIGKANPPLATPALQLLGFVVLVVNTS